MHLSSPSLPLPDATTLLDFPELLNVVLPQMCLSFYLFSFAYFWSSGKWYNTVGDFLWLALLTQYCVRFVLVMLLIALLYNGPYSMICVSVLLLSRYLDSPPLFCFCFFVYFWLLWTIQLWTSLGMSPVHMCRSLSRAVDFKLLWPWPIVRNMFFKKKKKEYVLHNERTYVYKYM